MEVLAGSVFCEPKPQRNADHPTMKPVALIERMLTNSSKRGDIVLDPFGGVWLHAYGLRASRPYLPDDGA